MATKKTSKTSIPRASTSDLVSKLRQKAQNFSGGGGSKSRTPYFKMRDGNNDFRILLHPNYEDITGLLTYVKLHTGKNRSGGFSSCVNLSWLINEQDLVERILVENKRFTPQDVDKVMNNGDPFDILYKSLSSVGMEKDYAAARIGRHRVYVLVYTHGDYAIWETSKAMAESIIDLFDSYPEMIDPEEGFPVRVKKSGKGLKTNYSSPVPLIKEAGPIENDVEEVIMPDPVDAIISGTLSYNSKVEFLCRSHAGLVHRAGLELSDFGVNHSQVKTTIFDNEDDIGENEDLSEDGDQEE